MRITYSPRSCVAVRVYCSIESVSVPIRTTKAPESCTVTIIANSSATTESPYETRIEVISSFPLMVLTTSIPFVT